LVIIATVFKEGDMLKAVKSKTAAFILIASIIIFYSPHYLEAQNVDKGNLIGFVFEKDGTTPVEGAIVTLRNISTGTVYESSKSDKLGILKTEGVEEGLYIAGISTKKGNFNVDNPIGIEAAETTKVSFALKTEGGEQEKTPKPKPRGLAKFFLSSAGVAIIIAASSAIIYGIIKLSEKEPEASPFRR
jgi:hypothetical protein